MTQRLPRQTYITPAQRAAEAAVASLVGRWAGAKWLKIGDDPDDEQKTRVDGLFYRGSTVVNFSEIRTCRFIFGEPGWKKHDGWIIGRKKVVRLRRLYTIVQVPCFIIVRFGCGTIGAVNSATDFDIIPKFGRSDRGDAADWEVGALFKWRDFYMVKLPDLSPEDRRALSIFNHSEWTTLPACFTPNDAFLRYVRLGLIEVAPSVEDVRRARLSPGAARALGN